MKYLLMVVLLFSFNQVRAVEGFLSGNDLLGMCEAYFSDTGSFAKGSQCFGYIQGVQDAQNVFADNKLMKAIWCAPKTITATQLVRVVTKYLQEYPEELHTSGMSSITVALIKAFPCE